MQHSIEMIEAGDDSVRAAIARPLIEYNLAQTGISDHHPIAIVIRDEHGAVIGGLWGRTAYAWLYVELLVVPEVLRGRGIGSALMDRAEAEAARRGCRAAWLDTFSFQARGFYEKRGYRCFGELTEYPPGFARYFMSKPL
jgi:GNAT superfamily N-acetyltransferase